MRRRVLIAVLVVSVGVLLAAVPALGFVSGLTADSKGTISVGGTMVTVSGTYQCDGDTGEMGVRVRQIKGPSFTEGFFEGPAVCDGTVQTWSAIITAPTGATWKSGKATLGAFVEDIDNFVEIQTTIRLGK
jgi:Family of unknown function (DUF6299)